MTEYILHKEKSKCYGCRACEKVCSQKAITMEPDDEGFLYPVLNESLCINCGLCKKVCPHDNDFSVYEPLSVYALQHNSEDVLSCSSSGGAFSALADYVTENGGEVCGCVFDDNFRAVHTVTENTAVIEKMKGSKYVQSDTANSFTEVKVRLEKGQTVLFTGTPCQVDGLKRFLKKDYENLVTVDLICHGVPSPLLLSEYIKYTEKNKGKITDLSFRNKQLNGWNASGSVTHIKHNREKTVTTSAFNDSFYQFFMRDAVSRMCCYSCKYATHKRVGDFTIGDYWNIPDVVPQIEYEKGVSVVFANTKKAEGILDEIKDNVSLYETELSSAVKGNGNLSRPSEMPEARKNIYKKITEKGYEATVKEECHFSYVIPFIKRHLPKGLKKYLKKVLG